LAHALGGRAEKSSKGWGLGSKEIAITEPQQWMTPALLSGEFFFCHQDQVVDLPPNATLLAGNEFCPHGMFAVGKHVLGIQAHPEFTTEIMQRAIFQLQPQMVSALPGSAADATRPYLPHSPIMAQWIVNFFQQL
jgi:GMP synthase-like glutamine amidotransferase